jgi:hypothetical protein
MDDARGMLMGMGYHPALGLLPLVVGPVRAEGKEIAG